MDKMQAKKIRRHLFAIDNAIDKAFAAIFELNKEDRRPFIEAIGDLESRLHFEVLELVYTQHPELRPPPVPPPSAVICGGKT
jgi:hypothetical protein